MYIVLVYISCLLLHNILSSIVMSFPIGNRVSISNRFRNIE